MKTCCQLVWGGFWWVRAISEALVMEWRGGKTYLLLGLGGWLLVGSGRLWCWFWVAVGRRERGRGWSWEVKGRNLLMCLRLLLSRATCFFTGRVGRAEGEGGGYPHVTCEV